MATALDPHAAVVAGASGASPRLTTADGQPLARALARSSARARRRAFLLVAPLLLFTECAKPVAPAAKPSLH